MNIKEIKIDFDDRSRSRLESRRYTTDYTDIPNSSLPKTMLRDLDILFNVVTGSNIEEEEPIYTIQSRDGFFRKLYTPYVYCEEDQLYLRFGKSEAPIRIQETEFVPATKGVKFAFVETPINGYKTLCLKISYRQAEQVLVTSIPIRTKDFKNPPNTEHLDFLLSSGRLDEFYSLIGGQPNASSFETFLSGPLVATGYLPLGLYEVTECQWNNRGQFPSLHLQTSTEVPFNAPVPVRNEDGKYGRENVDICGRFRVKANSKLKKFINAEPNFPFSFEVIGHGEYNGNPVAYLTIDPTNGFVIENCEDILDMGF
jgi:hypothetical protein